VRRPECFAAASSAASSDSRPICSPAIVKAGTHGNARDRASAVVRIR
jgi:hypothetical protein